jgi:tripartite-type tricarboxylate transporter receptor subunit TctC
MVWAAHAQSFPNKPVSLIVPFTTGGSNDAFARILAQELKNTWAQTILVDNKPGAGGSLGANLVAHANPDGHKLMLMSSAFTINAAMQPGVAPDPIQQFKPIALVGKGPMILAASKSSGILTIQDLVAHANLAMELLASMAGIQLTAIPYKGGTQAITDLMGGHLQLYMGSVPQVMAQARGGKIIVLGSSGLKVSPAAPSVMPIAQTIPNYEIELWWGIFTPSGISNELAQKLNLDINNAIAQKKVADYLMSEGVDVSLLSTQEFGQFVKSELKRWQDVVAKSHLNG